MFKKARRGLKLKKVSKEDTEVEKQKIRKIVSPDVNYNKVKYKDEIYSLGDCLMIRDVNEGFLIGKLIKVIHSGGFKKYPYWPTVQVQWYYKKSDVSRDKNGLKEDDAIFNSISEYEVFRSTHLDIIFIETIVSRCKIYTYEEYEMLEEHTQSTFFCRASYDPVAEMLNPPFDQWEKSCLCCTPLNPDQLYIKCDKCEKWFHPKCCNIDENAVQSLSEFFCKNCRN